MRCVCVCCARVCVCVRHVTCARVGGSDYGPRGLRCTSCATYNYDYLIAVALCNVVMSGLTHATGSAREREADSPLLSLPPPLSSLAFIARCPSIRVSHSLRRKRRYSIPQRFPPLNSRGFSADIRPEEDTVRSVRISRVGMNLAGV